MSEGFGSYLVCLWGILWREALRFLHQRERFIAALVRPLVWLFIFAIGFRSILGVSIVPPYETYITYETYIVPGLVAMIQLFSGMQSSLTLVYDREMGSMRVLLVSPMPRWFLLFGKLLGGTFVSLIQVYLFLVIAALTIVDLPLAGLMLLLAVLPLTGLMLGALGSAPITGEERLSFGRLHPRCFHRKHTTGNSFCTPHPAERSQTMLRCARL